MVTVISSPYSDVDIPRMSLVPFVMQRANECADRTAIVCAATGQSYTYHELSRTISQVASGLWALGIRKGDVVGLVSPNTPDFAVMFFAITTIGAVCSPVNPVATAEEIGAQFADSEALLLVTTPELHAKCSVAARLASTIREIVVFGEADGAIPFASLLAHGDAPADVEIDADNDVAALPYSSGTSGIPKGVMLTHRNLVANLCQVRGSVPIINGNDHVLAVLPFFHIYGMIVIMAGALVEGATIVTVPRFDLESVLRVIQDHRITVAPIVPPIILAFAKHPLVDQFDLRTLRMLFSGAAPLGAELASACADRLQVTVRQGYGLTETSPVTHSHPVDGDVVNLSSVGPSLANTHCRLVDPLSGNDVAIGEPGELWIRGPQVMKGYFNKPEATAACLDEDGWLHTGDVAVVDARGWFTIVDRVKELIKYKGLQVAPAELEAVLLSHPQISDAAVIPVADDEAGEVPKAFIVVRSGNADGTLPALDAEQVMAFVAARVSPYKKVRAVAFVDSIPKSPSGKILRRLLVERERAATAPA